MLAVTEASVVQVIGFPSDPPAACLALSERAVRRLGPAYEPALIVFDDADYHGDSNVLDEFRDIAFSWVQGRPIDRVPEYLKCHMLLPACESIVWLSRRAIAFEPPLLLWVLAHELRHVFQSREEWPRERTRQVSQAVRREAKFRHMPPSVFGPDELDAELCALQVVEAELGHDARDDLLRSNPRCPDRAYGHFLVRLAGRLKAEAAQGGA